MKSPLLLALLIAAPTAATDFHFDLGRLFATGAAEAAQREETLQRAARFEHASPNAIADGRALARWLADYDALAKDLHRNEMYVYLRAERDRDDRAAAEADSTLEKAIDAVNAAADTTLAALDASALDGWFEANPSLRNYRFFVQTRRADAARQGDVEAQRYVVQPVLERLVDAYKTLRKDALAAHEARPEASSASAAETESQRREREFRAKWQPFLDNENAFAAVLLPSVALQAGAAHLKGFSGALEAAYSRAGLDQRGVDAVLARLRRSDAGNGYVRVVADAAAARLHVSATALHAWDLDAADGFRPPDVDLPAAVPEIIAAERRLGREYDAELARLLDSRNGRFEWCRGKRCDDAGFSVGFAGTDSGLFYGAYDGSTNAMRAIAHESGHAVHRQLMNLHQPIAAYNKGPHFLFESFAILGELVFMEHLYRTADTPAAKAYYLHRFLDQAAFQIYGSARETALEEAIHDGIADGSVRNAADLDALTLKVFADYTAPTALDPQMKVYWARNRLYFTDPLYDVNYLYAGLLALTYLDRLERDPDGFPRRYLALLENGFNDSPGALLEKFLGIDLDADALVSTAEAEIGKRSAELARIYEAAGAPH